MKIDKNTVLYFVTALVFSALVFLNVPGSGATKPGDSVQLDEVDEAAAEAVEDRQPFMLATLDGGEIAAGELFSRADYTLLNIWTSWCGYCAKEMPELQALDAELSQRGGQVVLLLFDAEDANEETAKTAKAILEQTDNTLTCLLANDVLRGIFHVSAYPTSFVIDSGGYVISREKLGADSAENYAAWFDGAVAAHEAQTGKE